MHKFGIWKPETDSQTLPTEVSPMLEKQKKYTIQDDLKTYKKDRI